MFKDEGESLHSMMYNEITSQVWAQSKGLLCLPQTCYISAALCNIVVPDVDHISRYQYMLGMSQSDSV